MESKRANGKKQLVVLKHIAKKINKVEYDLNNKEHKQYTKKTLAKKTEMKVLRMLHIINT